jgi:CRISPR-associated protein Csm2
MTGDNYIFKSSWIRDEITPETVSFAKEFGRKLASNGKRKEMRFSKKEGREVEFEVEEVKLTTSQLRKFFGEVKRQQTIGYKESSFILLKPKLAYAVGRVKDGRKYYKIEDLYNVLSNAIDIVVSPETTNKEKAFRNFIAFFEAIVAYHKSEENK